jgi:hypothetical protein
VPKIIRIKGSIKEEDNGFFQIEYSSIDKNKGIQNSCKGKGFVEKRISHEETRHIITSNGELGE